MARTEVKHYRVSDSTVERRETTYRGHMIRYRSVRRGDRDSRNRAIWRVHFFWSANTSRFGAIREFVQDRRDWHCVLYEIIDVRTRTTTRVGYLSSELFED